MDNLDILTGWKAIASYLGVSEFTAKKWQKRGLPVKKMGVKGRSGSVIARKADIFNWAGKEFPTPNSL